MPETYHKSTAELADYVAGTQALEAQLDIENHLDECSRCMALARDLFRQHALLRTITARNHSRALDHSVVSVINTALDAAPAVAVNRPWSQRLTDWKERRLGRVQGLVQLIADEGRQALRAKWDDTAFLAPGGWQFQPATRFRGAQEDEVIVEGQPEIRIRTTRKREEPYQLRVTIPAHLVSGDAPLVLLIPLEQPEAARIVTLYREGANWVAEVILGEEPSQWLVALEPLPGGIEHSG